MRSLSPALLAEISKAEISPILLVSFSFDSQAVHLWSGVGPLNYNHINYLGTGELLAITPVRETKGVEASGVSFKLSGVPSNLLSLALTEPYQGRPVSLSLAFMAGEIVIGHTVQFAGFLDVMGIEEGGSTSTITVTAENKLVDLLRSRERRYTHEDQQIDYPGDLGLEYVAGIQDKEIKWGPK